MGNESQIKSEGDKPKNVTSYYDTSNGCYVVEYKYPNWLVEGVRDILLPKLNELKSRNHPEK